MSIMHLKGQIRAQKDYARSWQKAEFYPCRYFSNWIFYSLPFPYNNGCQSIVRLRELSMRANKVKWVKIVQSEIKARMHIMKL